MTDYQFKTYLALKGEYTMTEEDKPMADIDYEAGETGMTDYQFATYQKLLYEVLKIQLGLNKSSEDVLAFIAELFQIN